MKQLLTTTLTVLGVLMMGSCQGPGRAKLSDTERDQIKAEVKQAAIDHLHSKDARTALSHYMDDAIAVTNTTLFPSINDLSDNVNTYYNTLKEVNLAVWDEIFINVINSDTALFTATCRYSFTNTSDEKIDMKGIGRHYMFTITAPGKYRYAMNHLRCRMIDKYGDMPNMSIHRTH